MPIRIEKVNVKNLGPITELNMSFGDINLIFGHNERGKTHLVEFILNSLFKMEKPSIWDLRENNASGQILLSGLTTEPLLFSPTSKKKLDDYWVDKGQALPIHLSRLLIVKGGELAMAKGTPGGVNYAILKEYLSNEKTLDEIQSRISNTIQTSKIDNGQISGRLQGEIKDRTVHLSRIKAIDDIFNKIDSNYSGGQRQTLSMKLRDAESEYEQICNAKRHLAYQIAQQITILDEKIELLPESAVNTLAERIGIYKNKESELINRGLRQKEKETNSVHYLWLKNAIDAYEKRTITGASKPSLVFPILIIGLLILTLLSGFLAPVAGTLFKGIQIIIVSLLVTLLQAFLVIISLILGWIYFKKTHDMVDHAVDIHEIEELSAEFENRFGRKLTNVADMGEVKDSIEKDYYESSTLITEIEKGQAELDNLRLEILTHFDSLIGDKPKPEFWNDKITGVRKQLREFKTQREHKNNELLGLHIIPSDYLSQYDGEPYNKVTEEELNNKISQLKLQMEAENASLASLAQAICQETGDVITTPLDKVVENLKQKRFEYVKKYQDITAKIIAGILLNLELQSLQKEQKKTITEGLQTPHVINPLKRITKRYENLDIKDDILYVSDIYNEYPLSNLSTGAQEQVLLALRLGFASKLLGHDSLFIILDDAFQHSDWNRREWLIDEMLELAHQNWQIIYFTMDNHIRDLFQKKCDPSFNNRFQSIDLTDKG